MGTRHRATIRKSAALAAVGLAVLAGTAAIPTAASATSPAAAGRGLSRHVLLLSVDGMHQADLQWYVEHHPRSALAALVRRGTDFTHARTPFPSDSFPGLVGQLTGGNPKTTGIYYDVTYNHALLDPSRSKTAEPSARVCKAAGRGANVPFDESIDKDSARLDAGQGLPSLPHDVMDMTGNPRRLLNPAALPINPTTCRRVYPHSYLRVNTVFEVVKNHGMRTAWADKHPAYEILDGPLISGPVTQRPRCRNSFTMFGGDLSGASARAVVLRADTRRYDALQVEAWSGSRGRAFRYCRARMVLPTVDS